MSKGIPVKTVRFWLTVITRNPAVNCYSGGIKLFLRYWENKSPAEVRRLCLQVREVVICDEQFAISVFGMAATIFFKPLVIQDIKF